MELNVSNAVNALDNKAYKAVIPSYTLPAVYTTLSNGSSLRRFPQATNCLELPLTVRPVCIRHTFTILFYSVKGDHPEPSTLLGLSSHGHLKEYLPRDYPGQQLSPVSYIARAP